MNKKDFNGFIPPARIFENVYFVGTHDASTHVIDTGRGLILIDAGMNETLDVVIDNMREVGLSEKDIKIILLSHGHYDHAGAVSRLKKLCGAKVYLGQGDLKMVTGEEDTSLSKLFGVKFSDFFTPDTLLSDGDKIKLGNTEILCLSTSGHTEGTLSFFFNVESEGKTYTAGMHGGVGTNTLTAKFLKENNLPFSNREKYINGIEKVKNIKVDIFLGNHVGNNDTEGKIKRVLSGEKNAFLSPCEWEAFLNSRIEKMKEIIKEETDMQNTCDAILKEKIIVIVRGVKRDDLLRLADACYNAGIRLLECTYDATGKIPDEEIGENIKILSEKFKGKMLIGAGTVLTEKQVELTKKAGGKFIISPDTNVEIIKKTKKENLVSIPGALTPTEAATAHRAGADFVKLFPVGALGEKYLKDVSAPLSHIRFLAVGGVNADNIKTYIENGALGVGIGSDIVNKALIEKGDFEEIEKRAKRYVDAVK